MKRAIVLTPLAVTGCVTEHAESRVTWNDALAQGTNPAELGAALVSRWQLPPENPWAVYSKLTLPSASEHLGSEWFDVAPPLGQTNCAAVQVGLRGVPPDVMWLVDLPGAQSVHFVAALSRASHAPVSPVLTFNNWPQDDELIPTREVLAALAQEKPQLPDPGVRAAPVFALDADRLAFAGEEVDPEQYDNRYIVGSHDLPGVDVLRAQGIRRVVYLVESRLEHEDETDDLNPILRAWQDAGIQVSIADLDDLCSLEAPGMQAGVIEDDASYPPPDVFWTPWFIGHAFTARPRELSCNLELFARAHGSFGGRHAYLGFGHGGFTAPSAGGNFHAATAGHHHGGIGGISGFGHGGGGG